MVVPAGNSTQIRCFLVYNAQLPQAVDANKTKVEVQKLVFLVTSVWGLRENFLTALASLSSPVFSGPTMGPM